MSDSDEAVPLFHEEYTPYENYPPELSALHESINSLSNFSLGRVTFQVFRDIGTNIKYHVRKYRTGDDIEHFVGYHVGSLRLQPHITECAIIPILDINLTLMAGVKSRLGLTEGRYAVDEDGSDIIHDLPNSAVLVYEAYSLEEVEALWPVSMYKTDFLRHQRFSPGEDPRLFGTHEIRRICTDIAPQFLPISSKGTSYRLAADHIASLYAWGGGEAHHTVLDIVKVHVSPAQPFIVKVMRSGNIVWEFHIQRWERATGHDEFVPMNAHAV